MDIFNYDIDDKQYICYAVFHAGINCKGISWKFSIKVTEKFILGSREPKPLFP